MPLGCWRSETSGRCHGRADSEVGPAVRILLPPAASLVRTVDRLLEISWAAVIGRLIMRPVCPQLYTEEALGGAR
jgi:hypothetical protein